MLPVKLIWVLSCKLKTAGGHIENLKNENYYNITIIARV